MDRHRNVQRAREQRVLRHLTHGFGFPHPGEGFALLTGPDAERVEDAMSEYLELHTFVFRNEATQDVFLVIMAKGIESQGDFRAMVQGMTRMRMLIVPWRSVRWRRRRPSEPVGAT